MKRELLIQRIESYKLFSYLFFTLPDAKFVDRILALNMGDVGSEDEGSLLLQQYIAVSQRKDKDALITELGVDRTQLLRGLTQAGPRPPYESLYIKAAPQDTIGNLNVTYAQSGYGVAKDVNESSEYIGVEINFMQLLCEQELAALDAGAADDIAVAQTKQKDFFGRHLGLWAVSFAEEMLKFARTDFYRASAMLLRDFMQDEETYLKGVGPLN